MQRYKAVLILFLVLLTGAVLLMPSSCSVPPETFIETKEPEKIDLELNEYFTYDEIWNKVFSTMVRNFSIEIYKKEDGYIQTAWTGLGIEESKKKYRTRVIIQFNPYRDQLTIAPEAKFHTRWLFGLDTGWVAGMDESIVEDIVEVLIKSVGKIS